ncbi:MAG: PKD domain-containing protein [Methanobacteriota archaeon]|nr:MAG: PKD domain-containing protein [Euryarchaeota archaeon]
MRSETVDRIIGGILLVVGIIILIIVLGLALALTSAPGDFLRQQAPEEEAEEGPVADFSWSSNDLEVTFTDKSQAGSASIIAYDWNFGDGNASDEGSPVWTYGSYGQFEAFLEVQDENGKRSSARSLVNLVSGESRSGNGQTDFSSTDVGFDFGSMAYTIGIGILITGLFMVMVFVGSTILKAGWTMMKPRPDKLKVKLKPKEMTIKQVGGPATAPPETLQPTPAPAPPAPEPAPPPVEPPEPPEPPAA